MHVAVQMMQGIDALCSDLLLPRAPRMAVLPSDPSSDLPSEGAEIVMGVSSFAFQGTNAHALLAGKVFGNDNDNKHAYASAIE
jgi:hypothetical protein